MKLTTKEVQDKLGITSADTVKNWLQGGEFPGSSQTQFGEWEYDADAVEEVAAHMRNVRERNKNRNLSLFPQLTT